LVEQWNGNGWSMVASPNPPGQTPVYLNAIACPTSATCIAVGDYHDPHGGGTWERTFAERWDIRHWSISPTPNPPGIPFARLNGIACSSSTSCYAVGEHSSHSGAKSLIEHWNGTGWSIDPTPNPPGNTAVTLNAVACPIPSTCYAVGKYSTSTWSRTFVELRTGTYWSIVPSPNPPGSHDLAVLTSVACPTSNACFAVGLYTSRDGNGTVIERWNGVNWSTMPTPISPNVGLLLGVACSSTTQCFAVGYDTVHIFKTVIERWNGTTWSVIASPSRTGITTWGVLVAVACPSNTTCHAVGIGSPGDPFAQHWNGKHWAITSA